MTKAVKNRLIKVAALTCLLLLSGCFGPEPGTVPTTRREKVRAETLLDLVRYVEWPESVFVRSNAPIVVATYGETLVIHDLVRGAKGKRFEGRPMVVRQFFWPADPNCNLLYIGASEAIRVPAILQKLQHSSVLTVSELPNFAEQGGMMRLRFEDERARFQVNLTSVTNAQLKVSARLLSVAEFTNSTVKTGD